MGKIKTATDIYLKLFNKNKNRLEKFLTDDFVDYDLIDDYEENLKLIKLISERSKSIIEVNSFYNLSSIALLAGKPQTLVKIDDKINNKYYNLINYIDNIELLLYERHKKMEFNNNFSVDSIYINNIFQKDYYYKIYDNIFSNVTAKKYVFIDGFDDYFSELVDVYLSTKEWKIYYLNENKFNFVILKNI